MSRGYAKGRARRREILLAALNAFAEQGFRATSMREIAEMVGLSQAGLLHHFSSKNELLEEVLRLRDEEQRAFNERFGRRDGLNAVRYLIDLVELNARQVELVRLYTVLAGESVGGRASGAAVLPRAVRHGSRTCRGSSPGRPRLR
ncbi:HTH-type transcriptional repressor KstR2 [Actinomadura madurae]|nr:helix-turn-helix domain-containing protein [Actinomadura madurae]SPT50161.1 HTH-type transcriptional repressor KstR2 [Actinomadura madurae]